MDGSEIAKVRLIMIIMIMLSGCDGSSAETATEVDRLTIMVKMPEGYDPEHGDWWYARYDPTGTEVINSGQLVIDCRDCHSAASDTDYLFSIEVLAAAGD